MKTKKPDRVSEVLGGILICALILGSPFIIRFIWNALKFFLDGPDNFQTFR